MATDPKMIANALLGSSILPQVPNALRTPSIPMPPQRMAGGFGTLPWAEQRLNQLQYDKRLSPGQSNPVVDAKIVELRNFLKTGGQSGLPLHLADQQMYGG